MPELPEVEAIRRVIEPQIQGLAIEQIAVNRPEVVAHPTADEFCRRLTGQIFDSVARRGKYLVIMLKSGDRIVIHLRMTGCLLLTPGEYPEEKHTHIIFRLNNGKELRFSDTRRFGRFWLLPNGEVRQRAACPGLHCRIFVCQIRKTEENHQRMSDGAKRDCRNWEYLFGRNFIYGKNLPGTASKQSHRRRMESPCRNYPGASVILYPKK